MTMAWICLGPRGLPGYGTSSAKAGTALGKLGYSKIGHSDFEHSLSELKFDLEYSLNEAI